jgi:hypothetical protein
MVQNFKLGGYMEKYKIVRFKFHGKSKVILRGLSLEDAQAHCRMESTHKKDSNGNVLWFDGYTKE